MIKTCAECGGKFREEDGGKLDGKSLVCRSCWGIGVLSGGWFQPVVGEIVLVFDSRRWAKTGDVGDNLKYWQPARVLRIYTAQELPLVDVEMLDCTGRKVEGVIIGGGCRLHRPCGHGNCGVSTTIAEQTSYGRGELDANGFWEIPCKVCAAVAKRKRPEEAVWPAID